MDSKIGNKKEQVKKIITEVCDGMGFDGVPDHIIEIASTEIDSLYSDPPSPEMVCPHCQGSGQFHVDVSIRHAYRMADVIPCAYCNGTGKVPSPEPPEKLLRILKLQKSTGCILEAVVFSNGKVCACWQTTVPEVAIYENIGQFLSVRTPERGYKILSDSLEK